MRIHQLNLINFRNFEIQSLEFADQFNVLIGDNGTGKSALLDALAVAVGSLFLRFREVSARSIRPDDVRYVAYGYGHGVSVERQYPAVVECTVSLNDRVISYRRSLESLRGRTTEKDAKEMTYISEELQERVSSGEDVQLPLIAYYGTGRLWQQRQTEIEYKRGSRFEGYDKCLDPASNEKSLLEWFKHHEMINLQQQQKGVADSPNVLEAARTAIANCVEDWTEVYFDLSEDTLMGIDTEKETNLPFRMLSDGVRNMLAMVGDIAHRAAVLNPFMQAEAANQISGVVLIDEIDLHLHPKWQRHIVADLRRTFPNIQFIVTTHSPFIIQSLRPDELIDLNVEDRPEAEYQKSSIEDIVEQVMGVDMPSRSQRYQKMIEVAEEYYKVLEDVETADTDQVEDIKLRLDELIEPFSDDAAYQAFLNMERTAALLKREKDEEGPG
jgi:predicted ATP-binding protein involved in virulence